MTEQFNLSKKRTLSLGVLNNKVYGYTEEDVKEFIRELKQDANKIFEDSYTLTKYQFDKILKERAGKELIEGKK